MNKQVRKSSIKKTYTFIALKPHRKKVVSVERFSKYPKYVKVSVTVKTVTNTS